MGSQNLAEMAAIIYNQYHKPSFITFNNNLIKAMSFQISADDDTKTNPMKAVSGVQDLIFTWDTHNLWAQMLLDHFWSAVLLRSLNSHALFRDVLQKTQELIHTHEHDPSSGRLPIFKYTSIDIQNNLQSDKTFNSGKPTTTSDMPPYPDRSTHNQYKSQSMPVGVKQAAAATAPTVPSKTVSIAATPPSSSATARPASAASGIGGPNNPRTY